MTKGPNGSLYYTRLLPDNARCASSRNKLLSRILADIKLCLNSHYGTESFFQLKSEMYSHESLVHVYLFVA